MNKASRILYSAKHIRRMKLFERQFLRPVYNALQSQIKPVVTKLKHDGPHEAIAAVDRIVINDEVGAVIMDLYSVIGLYFANKTIYDLNKSVKPFVKALPPLPTYDGKPTYHEAMFEQKAGFGFNAEFIRAILDYFTDFLLDKAVVPITQTTKQQILNVLNQGIEEGWGVDKIATMLQSSELTLWRARMIVRTEANKAMNYGSRLGESKSVWETTKTWIAANDHRTRHSHHSVDDETIDFKQYFHVPIYRGNIQVGNDLMEGPGDIHATAGNVINCRCVLAYAAKRDENGRLIRKKTSNSNISVLLPQDIFRPSKVITI